MNKEESLALFAKGRDAWNAWAEKMLDARAALEADGSWGEGRSVSEWNEATRAWHAAAAADFSDYRFQETADFFGFVFPSHVEFEKATFTGDVGFHGASFTGSEPAGRLFTGWSSRSASCLVGKEWPRWGYCSRGR